MKKIVPDPWSPRIYTLAWNKERMRNDSDEHRIGKSTKLQTKSGKDLLCGGSNKVREGAKTLESISFHELKPLKLYVKLNFLQSWGYSKRFIVKYTIKVYSSSLQKHSTVLSAWTLWQACKELWGAQKLKTVVVSRSIPGSF